LQKTKKFIRISKEKELSLSRMIGVFMLFNVLATYYQQLEETSSRLTIRDILVDLFEKSSNNEDIGIIARLTSGQIFYAWEETKIGMAEKSVLNAVIKAYGIPKKTAEELLNKFGDVGTVIEKVRRTKKIKSLMTPKPWTIQDILDGLRKIGSYSGKDSTKKKDALIARYVSIMSKTEAKFFVRMFTNDLRIGVKDKSIIDALAIYKFNDIKVKETLEKAYNVYPDIQHICLITLNEGLEGIGKISLKPGIPFHGMAAQRLDSFTEIHEKLGDDFAVEWKYDGERIQVHIDKEQITLYTRRYDNATNQFPDIVKELLRVFKGRRLIFEGELVAYNKKTGKLRPFQELMRRRRQYDIEQISKELPVNLFVFDLLFEDGKEYIDFSYKERRNKLEILLNSIDSNQIQPSHQKIISSDDEFEEAFSNAIDAFCEGLIAKRLDASYKSGKRGWEWIKLKKDYTSQALSDTFDLVVVGGFHGRGRRTGMIGTFLLACYNKNTEKLETVCKLGTGFSEEQLKEFSKLLQPLTVISAVSTLIYNNTALKPDIWFKPEIVFEIQGAELTISPSHTCAQNLIEGDDRGLSLRFPRFIKLREDRAVPDITTSDQIFDFYLSQSYVKTDETKIDDQNNS
jgi:DNA ligase-1